MKRISFHTLLFLVLASMVLSCKKSGFLDQTVTTSLDEMTTFSDSSNAMQFLNGIYTNIGLAQDPRRFANGGYAAGLEAGCDEAEGPNSSSTNGFIQFATGSVNPTVVPNDIWATGYSNIRAVNQFLKHLPVIPWNSALKQQAAAEARFLRAWYYAMLMQHYGGVPLIGDTIFASADHINISRSAYRSCINYVLSECDAAAAVLPVAWSGAQYGRISKAACLALKSRLLLYAASPLFNNGGLAQGSPGLDSVVAYPDADPNRWQLAADAAKAVILLNAYSLFVDSTSKPGELGYGFQELFTRRYNNEYILNHMMGENKYLESLWDVPSRGGSGGSFPYQEIVDAFPMSNGLDITDPASGYDPNHPYQDRDPRLNYSIIHDSTLRVTFGTNQPSPVQLYINTSVSPPVAASGDAVYKGTPTGLYIYKMMDPSVINNSLSTASRVLPLIRYAEILLNFAEATNEATGPSVEVYQAVEAIRQRAGLRPFALPSGLDQAQMRAVIQKERRLELAFEGHRFFDVRRWMIAGQTDNLMMHGMEVDRGPGITYKTFNVRKHNFTKAMYLWPIPLSEIAKSPGLLQNPLY
ncbi:RagB/SusD family nutrient uptake outer membrane protein [Flavitalea sp. BT771]|uniref:RagB/SusD family nutrient uptake outer membrane protein n=1 Tax=Flavitalea sp. BT771 TaxID=3063329 RepID=UPI0026E247A8|nr:RagB/SusD family nutrient uptake outer membrane protein [Flavitalea sp. BT771]MDO6429940.1 RagB/SusD family nutrient uptake outer membrane protein [Flavitalea sp. BT771]MDV6217932.1 RagB/SusD family nutrient uptake outer membrane protein [Flavitalea sp. BT771]